MGCSEKAKLGLFAAYLAAIVAALANPANLNYEDAYLLTQGANITTLLLLAYCKEKPGDAFIAAVLGVGFTLRATGTWEGGSRWDSLLVTVGMLIILQHAFFEVVPRTMPHRLPMFFAFSCIIMPILSALPHLVMAPQEDVDVLAQALGFCRDAYGIVDQPLPTDDPDPTAQPTRPPQWTLRNDSTDTTAGVYRNGTVIFVAFAGTQSMVDWRTNINILGDRVPDNWGCGGAASMMRTHRGFTKAFNSVSDEMLRALNAEFTTSTTPTTRIVFCGHSLGGALATMAAMFACCRVPALQPYISVITFGAPQVGDAHFVKFFNQVVPRCVRVVNPMDPVPRVLQAQLVHVKGYYPVGALSLDSTFKSHEPSTYADAINGSRARSIVGSVVPAVVVASAIGLYVAWQLRRA